MKQIPCPSCTRAIDASSSSCTNCGARKTPLAQCPACGQLCSVTAYECPRCGHVRVTWFRRSFWFGAASVVMGLPLLIAFSLLVLPIIFAILAGNK